MGLICCECGTRFYLPPGEQTWLEKHCTGSISKPGIPQFCIDCMERRFTRPVPQEEQVRSRDGSMRMPNGEKQIELYYAQKPVKLVGQKLKTPWAHLGADCASIQFQRLKTGDTFFGRLSKELPNGALTVFLDKNEQAPPIPSNVPLTGVMITIDFISRKCLSFDATNKTVSLERPFPHKIFSATSYYIFQSLGASSFPEPLCGNDSIAKVRAREVRDRMDAAARAELNAQRTKIAQERTIFADMWGPPCKIGSLLGNDWNIETATGPQRRLQHNCLNYVNALVASAENCSLVDHTRSIRQARMLAFCMGRHWRCGQDSLLFRMLQDEDKLVQKIIKLALPRENLPKWLLDRRTSRNMADLLRLPVAVCVTAHSEQQLQQIREKKTKETQAEKQRLLMLSRKRAQGKTLLQTSLKSSIVVANGVHGACTNVQDNGPETRVTPTGDTTDSFCHLPRPSGSSNARASEGRSGDNAFMRPEDQEVMDNESATIHRGRPSSSLNSLPTSTSSSHHPSPLKSPSQTNISSRTPSPPLTPSCSPPPQISSPTPDMDSRSPSLSPARLASNESSPGYANHPTSPTATQEQDQTEAMPGIREARVQAQVLNTGNEQKPDASHGSQPSQASVQHAPLLGAAGRRRSGSRSLMPPPDLEAALSEDLAQKTAVLTSQLSFKSTDFKQSPDTSEGVENKISEPKSIMEIGPKLLKKDSVSSVSSKISNKSSQISEWSPSPDVSIDGEHSEKSFQSDTSSPKGTLRPKGWSRNLKKRITLGIKPMTSAHDECLLVVDRQQRCIFMFSSQGNLETKFGADILYQPSSIVVQSKKNSQHVVVSDTWLHTLVVFELEGVYKSRIGYFGTTEGHFNCPTSIALGRDDSIFVADTGNNRVQVLASDGTFVRAFGSQGFTAGHFDKPEAIAVNVATGAVVVSERGNARVQVLDEYGTCLHIIKDFQWARDVVFNHDKHLKELVVDSSGSVEELGLPAGLAFSNAGSLLVTDIYYHRIIVFNESWEAVQKYGSGGGWDTVSPWLEPFQSLRHDKHQLGNEKFAPFGGGGSSEFNCPLGICVGSTGRVIVADTWNKRVQVFL